MRSSDRHAEPEKVAVGDTERSRFRLVPLLSLFEGQERIVVSPEANVRLTEVWQVWDVSDEDVVLMWLRH